MLLIKQKPLKWQEVKCLQDINNKANDPVDSIVVDEVDGVEEDDLVQYKE